MSNPRSSDGSLVLGFLAGFFGGCLGFALVFFLAKGAPTKKGAMFGLIGQVVLGLVGSLLVFAFQPK